ncbi:hypothetical protein UY3_10963 [Chelonia mydas]|uniref:Uncharacterized protein n=1 Tax=Chelonia mydas TaxID=8469 RepID=M7B8R3_CHEMY|nr:hypothetical protein UY3_10963 [Chelonia mydas]
MVNMLEGTVLSHFKQLLVTSTRRGVSCRGDQSKLRNFSYVNNVAEVDVLRSTYRGVSTPVNRLLPLPCRLYLCLLWRWSTGVDGRVLGGRFIVSRLDTINQSLLDRSLSTDPAELRIPLILHHNFNKYHLSIKLSVEYISICFLDIMISFNNGILQTTIWTKTWITTFTSTDPDITPDKPKKVSTARPVTQSFRSQTVQKPNK